MSVILTIVSNQDRGDVSQYKSCLSKYCQESLYKTPCNKRELIAKGSNRL